MERELPPAEMLRAVNQALMERPIDDRYVALTYGAWDDQHLTLCIANSGLPRPVHVRNGKMEIIDAIGIPLGLFPNTTYDEKQIQAQPGDIFIFLSDGIMEACNLEEEEFGYDRLATALRDCDKLTAPEISEVLQQALAAHCGDLEPEDDQTLIVMKVNGPAA